VIETNKEEMEADRKAWQEEMAAMRDRWMNDNHNETMACRETMEARLEEKEPTLVDRKPEVAQQLEVPNKDAVLKPVKGWMKRHRGKKQAAGQCEEPKELTQGDCGSWMKLASTCRKVSRRATVA
jgi:hypothetical protein